MCSCGGGLGLPGPPKASAATYLTGAHAAAIGDLNGDGKPDLAVASVYGNRVTLLLNHCLPAPSCDDANPCTSGDHWDPMAQACAYTNANEGGACGNGGACASGKCVESLGVTTAGNGSGTVISGIGGIDCPSACSASIALGRQVTLYATPGVGSSFAGFSGARAGTAPCVLQMTAARTVKATFTSP